jgi:hypothetical protein
MATKAGSLGDIVTWGYGVPSQFAGDLELIPTMGYGIGATAVVDSNLIRPMTRGLTEFKLCYNPRERRGD